MVYIVVSIDLNDIVSVFLFSQSMLFRVLLGSDNARRLNVTEALNLVKSLEKDSAR